MSSPSSGNDYLGVPLTSLERHYRNLEYALHAQMRCEYPVGTRLVFWRSSNQQRGSTGTVVGYSTAHGPELRVRYDRSVHVVGVHIGSTRFRRVGEGGAE